MADWLLLPRNENAPLAGLKVLELARVLAGPWAGQMLADLGADVIKVESPEGDNTRIWGPPWVEHGGETTSAYYHACNRGKRGIVADFRDENDLARVRTLAADADVVLENFKPGGLAKFGLDYATLSETNEALVYCSITGFGQDGPRRDEPGYDFVIQAMSGFMSLTGEPDGDPMKHGVSISDLACGTVGSQCGAGRAAHAAPHGARAVDRHEPARLLRRPARQSGDELSDHRQKPTAHG